MPVMQDYVDPFKGAQADPALYTHQHGTKRTLTKLVAAVELGESDAYQGHHLSVPGPSKETRWGGACRFIPMLWAEVARWHVTRSDDARAYCLSCNQSLQPEIEVLPHLPGTRRHFLRLERVSKVYALARASDHDREFMNHQIVVVDHESGDVIARNGYKPFSTSWA